LAVCHYFNIDSDEYDVIFTSNASHVRFFLIHGTLSPHLSKILKSFQSFQAARHVGESFPWGKKSTFAYLIVNALFLYQFFRAFHFDFYSHIPSLQDNHTSVLGIREFANKNGAKVKKVNIIDEDYTVDTKDLDEILKKSNPSDYR
jgi:hypothetical protein